MGNKVCCMQTKTQGILDNYDVPITKHIIIAEITNSQKMQSKSQISEKIEIPELLPKVRESFNLRNFFQEQQQKLFKPQVKRYRNDVYIGSLDANCLKPDGFGKMYKVDRSLYIGFFKNGKAHGKGAYIFADGSYYEGDFVNNSAEAHYGHFYSQDFKYTGGFKNNNFEGQGLQIGKDYNFDGNFHNGSRTNGILKWENETHVYTGKFNQQNKLHGKGTLFQPHGTYKGDFVDGEKHGKGVYHFKNGSRYEGDYFKGSREGLGTIFHGTGEIAYTGQVRKGLPNGRGSMISNKTRKLTQATWVDGIDASLLPQTN